MSLCRAKWMAVPAQSAVWGAWERHLMTSAKGVKGGPNCTGSLMSTPYEQWKITGLENWGWVISQYQHHVPILGQTMPISLTSVSPSETGVMIPASLSTWKAKMEICTDASRPG